MGFQQNPILSTIPHSFLAKRPAVHLKSYVVPAEPLTSHLTHYQNSSADSFAEKLKNYIWSLKLLCQCHVLFSLWPPNHA